MGGKISGSKLPGGVSGSFHSKFYMQAAPSKLEC